MKIFALLTLAVTLAGCATTTPAVAPNSDEFEIRATVLAVYNVVSGPAGRRDWNHFQELFAPNAQIVDGLAVMTPKEFAEKSTPVFNARGWFEWPVTTEVHRSGRIAHVWSTWEGREASNQEQPSARGVISFELVRIGDAWKVQSMLREQG
jgi:hypothetical protein